MKKATNLILLLAGTILVLTGPFQHVNAQDNHMHEEPPVADDTAIGEVSFDAACSEEVRDDLDRALGMLHHMMYVSARQNFKEIAEADPECAMAYWGMATTLFQPLWGTRPTGEELKQGWKHIRRAEEVAVTDREKLLIESTKEFFREPETAEFSTRIKRWTDGMESAYASYPDDLDIAAFYALSRLTLAQFAERPSPLLDEAETILRGVFEQAPAHPGAIHYTIHATDIDGRAENALDIVEAYGEIAPSVPHALHMPTHIYVRLGDWDKVIEWNIKSAEAALNHPVNGAESHHYLHAVDYLIYAHLQQGLDEKAAELYRAVLSKNRHQASFVSAFHFAAIPARIAVEQHDWERARSLEPRSPGYLPWDDYPWTEGLSWYAKGLGSIHTGDPDAAREAEQKLQDLRNRAKDSGADNMAAYIETDRLVLQGWIEHAEGNNIKAVELMRSAAELEAGIEKHPVTPGTLQPPNEAMGNLLMKLDRPNEALEAYTASDDIWPERYNTLLGAARAAKAAGKKKVARQYYKRLLTNAANSKRSDIMEAQEFVTQQ